MLVVTLTAAGCTSGQGPTEGTSGAGSAPSESTSTAPSAAVTAAADKSAASYLEDLERYQRQVARAAAKRAAWKPGDPPAVWRASERAFATALDAAPELESVDRGAESSDAYARTAEIAQRVQGFVDEHEWMVQWDIHEQRRVHSELYGLASESSEEQSRLTADYERTMGGPGGIAVKLKKAMQKEVAAELELLEAARLEVEGLAGKDSFTPSLRDHLLHELDVVEALGRRYADYVEAAPASAMERDLFRNGFAGGFTLPDGAVTNAPVDRTVALRKMLAANLSRLARAGDRDQPELPMAGDLYRELILGQFVPPGSGDGDAHSLAVDEQLYWLWHLREIEETPDEVFTNARLTIQLQLQAPPGMVRVNVPSRFDELAAMYAALGDVVNDPESMAFNKPWILELLERPYPDTLAEAVALAREAAELMTEDGSPAPPELVAIGPELRKALEQAADRLDSTPRFRRDFRAAVSATRPTASS